MKTEVYEKGILASQAILSFCAESGHLLKQVGSSAVSETDMNSSNTVSYSDMITL